MEHFLCPTCGPHVRADEDGCCATCGRDTITEKCGCIPPKQTGRKTVYKFADLLKLKKKFYKADAKKIGNIKSCASIWAKKNGVVVTTRIGKYRGKDGIWVYLVENEA